jgi:hypothetical protein
VFSLVYVSAESSPCVKSDLAKSLMNWRANNQRLELTGVLLYREGQILQLLEGPEEAVRTNFAVIGRDPRHTQVTKLSEETIPEREFPSFSMGYSSVVDTLAPRFPDLTEFFSTPVPLPETVMKVRRLFEWFRDSARLAEAY